MIALKLEQVGDRLDETARAELKAKAGDNVYVQRSPQGELFLETHEAAQEADDGRHERGRAFLKRYQKTLGDLTS